MSVTDGQTDRQTDVLIASLGCTASNNNNNNNNYYGMVWCVKDLLAQRQLNQDKIDAARRDLMLYVEVCVQEHLLTYFL